MTIMRDLQSVKVRGYGSTLDEYGQLVPDETGRDSEVAFRYYAQANVTDPRYVDIEAVGITKDSSIARGEVITFAQGDFRVKYIVPSDRWLTLLLVKI